MLEDFKLKSRENEVFDFNSMLLRVFSRYCYQLIFSEIFNISFDLEQKYQYSFSKDEIVDLSKKMKKDIVFRKNIMVPYEFMLSTFMKNYHGVLNIDIVLVNNGTFEKSYYEVTIVNDNKIELLPFFLNDKGFKTLISEFINKLWVQVLICIMKININVPNRINLTQIVSPLSDKLLGKYLKSDENEDLIFDVFHIIYSYYYHYKNKKKGLYVSADDILSSRGLIKNANAKGFRSGYKNEQRQKVRAALNILNSLDLVNVHEIRPFHYVFFPSSKIQNKGINFYPITFVGYNLKSQLWERRFSFYLYDNRKERHKIKDLIALVEPFCGSLKPMQLRDKTEDVLDKLCENGIIKSWYYLKVNEEELTGKNWLDKWFQLYIVCRY